MLGAHNKRQATRFAAGSGWFWRKSRAGYLPDLAGAEAGADLAPSSTECEPLEERT
jgi:hypothetical protein